MRPSGSAHYQQTQVQKGSKTQRFIKCSVVRMRCNHAIRALEWPRYKDFAFSKNHYSRRLHQNPNRVFSRGWCCCATLPRKTRYSQVRHDGSKRLYIETLNLLRIEYLFNDFISALMTSNHVHKNWYYAFGSVFNSDNNIVKASAKSDQPGVQIEPEPTVDLLL